MRFVDEKPAFWRVIERAVAEGGARAEFDVVLEHMAGVDAARAKVAGKFERIRRGLGEPWIVPATAADLRDALGRGLEVRRGPRFAGTDAMLADWLEVEGFEPAGPDAAHEGLGELDDIFNEVADEGRVGLDLLESLSRLMELSQALLDESLAGLDDASREQLFEGTAAFHEAWYRNHFPEGELTPEQSTAVENEKALLARTSANRPLLLGVAGVLLRLAEPAMLDSLRARLAKVRGPVEGEEPDTLAVVGEGPGRVVLTGKKGTEHRADAALAIDLGGDDTWIGAAVASSEGALARVVLDLAGRDTYLDAGGGGGYGGPAFAVGGAALLVDRRGDDRYLGKRLANGASVLGFAALLDLAGDDRYEAEDFSEGEATGGIALLVDLEGDDAYQAWAFAQGSGIGSGFAALVDGSGDDTYLADLHWPDAYGDSGPDVYHGASQGYSTGIRSTVAGGFAALVDLGDGRDRYQAGSFSLGGGYYFGFGLKYDGGGDDETFGSRYGGGFGVHQAIGVLWDAGGDDAYTFRSVAHTGMAWDEGVGYLLEDGGDDTFQVGELGCGGAAQTGIAILIDRGGRDMHHSGKSSEGGTGSSEYHDKPALGVLLDFGGKKDTYSAEGRADGTLRVTPGVEVFLDSRAKTIERLAAGKKLE